MRKTGFVNQCYRTSVWVLLAQAMIIYWAVVVLRRTYFLLVHDEWLPFHSSTLIGGTLGLAVAMAGVAWWYRIEVSNGSIRGPTLWGGFAEIALSPALRFRETRILGFRYLKIQGRTKDSIWAALPVNNESELYALLRAQKPPDR